MATVTATSRPMKKPSLPSIQVGPHNPKAGPSSSSPSASVKRLPGQTTPQSTTNSNSANVNGTSRPNRRLHRLSTRVVTSESVPLDRKAMAKKFAEPYVASESFIFKKHRGKPPSLIIHLHPTHFRFDQQDGSFSYQSEMRIFIDHLKKKTVPHDMLEELRQQEVQFYDGWLIVRVIDHRTVVADANGASTSNDDEKPFSIHNHNNFITPSPMAPYPTKETKSESVKMERQNSVNKENTHSDLRSDDTIDLQPKHTKPTPKVYHVALAPTEISRHTDIVLDCMAPDPKLMARKQSQIVARTPGSGQPPTPIGTIPPTPSTDKPPPLKKQKLKIDPNDRLEYEAKVVNAMAPPLYLDSVKTLEEAEQLIKALQDEWHSGAPPSPKSRKRTVAELAADDAHAKAQERFLLIMDERSGGNSTAANAAGIEGQAGGTHFQPRFEKFNALDNIKREIAEKKQRENDRQLQEDEARRSQQQQQEEERRRQLLGQQQAERRRQQQLAQMQQQQNAHAAAVTAQRQQAAAAAAQRAQANGIPPQMQSQMANTQASSPVIRQGTPHAASSPIINNMQGGHSMIPSGSQQGQAGSPQRPGSAVQHGHPGVPMARAPSNQGDPSRNGTPQLANNTPGLRNATPVMRQGTPNQHLTQASPHGSMAAPTPQMGHAGMMAPGQMPNGVPHQMNQSQMQEIQRRQLLAAQQQQMLNNGMTSQMAQAQMQQLRAAQQAQLEQNAAIQRQQQQQQQQQHAAMQQGTPQQQHMSPSPAQNQKAAYNAQLAEHAKAQMQGVSQGPTHGSPMPNQMTPQQAQMRMQQMQQASMLQQQQQQGQMGQQARPMNPRVQQFFQQTQTVAFRQLMTQAAVKYGGNMQLIPQGEKQQLQMQAQQQARNTVAAQLGRNNMQSAQMAQAIRQQQQAQQAAAAAAAAGGQMPNGMNTPGSQMNLGMNTPGSQMNLGMNASMQQRQHQMQAMQLQQAQNMMMQNQQQQQNSAQVQYQQQLNLLQQQQQQQQGGGGQR